MSPPLLELFIQFGSVSRPFMRMIVMVIMMMRMMSAMVRGSLINSVENSPQPRPLLIYLILTFLQIVFLFLTINLNIAKGRTDPSIQFFNFIECFDPINNNNLCSIFIITHFWRDCVKLHTPGPHKPSLNKRRN